MEKMHKTYTEWQQFIHQDGVDPAKGLVEAFLRMTKPERIAWKSIDLFASNGKFNDSWTSLAPEERDVIFGQMATIADREPVDGRV